MDAKHTPGPWKASPSGDGYLITRNDVFVVGHSLGAVRPSQAADEDACEANARLIAAAPDMLAALRRVADFIRNQDEGDPEFEYGWKSDEFMDEWLNIGAVIDKAEGRS